MKNEEEAYGHICQSCIYLETFFKKEKLIGTEQHTSQLRESVLYSECWNEFLFTHKHKFLFTHKQNMSAMSSGVRLLPHGVRCFFQLTPFHQMSIGK